MSEGVDQARAELFKRIQGGTKLGDGLRNVAKAADRINESSKVWANPSGKAPAMVARGTIGALTTGPVLYPVQALATAGGLAVTDQVSLRLLLNLSFVNWLAKTPKATPAGLQSYA